MKKLIKLYLDFLETEYGNSEEELKIVEKEILKNINEDYGLAYTTSEDGNKEFQVNVNFKGRKVTYLEDDKIIKCETFTKKDFENFLRCLDFSDLIFEFCE